MEDVFNVGNCIVFYVEDLVIYLLTISIFLSAIFCIRAKYTKSKNQLLIFKPLSLLLIICIAIVFPTFDLKYQIFIVLGLLFSLLGDFFIIFPEKHFKKSLIAFLFGHVCYITAFIVSSKFQLTYWIFLPIAVADFIYLKYILSYSGKMRIPVSIYIVVIANMGWLALERFNSTPTLGTFLAAMGALLFMISDGVLALNKFRKPFFSAELIVLSTYFIAQWLLAISVIKA